MKTTYYVLKITVSFINKYAQNNYFLHSTGKAKNNMENILKMTGLTDKFPGKITIKDIMSIDLEENCKQIYTSEELPWILLRRTLGVQSKARDLVSVNEHADNLTGSDMKVFDLFPVENTHKESAALCPLDVFFITIQCCEPMLKQLLFQKLYLCKIAFPFLQYYMHLNDWELSLWPFRSLVVESCDISQTFQPSTKEYEILELPVNTVTFANFGRPCDSKSKIANDLLSEEIQDTFFNMNCPFGTTPKSISRGTVEMFILPSTDQKENIFQESMAFFNMRGGIEVDFTTPVIKFISNISDVLVLLVDKSFLKASDEAIIKIITNFSAVIIVIANPLAGRDITSIKEFVKNLPAGMSVKIINTYNKHIPKNSKELSAVLKKAIVTKLNAVKVNTIDDRLKEYPYHLNDENIPDCSKGKEIANQVFSSMNGMEIDSGWKSFITPVHFNLSKRLGTSIRDLHRVKDAKDTHKSIENIKRLRQEQLKHISNPMKIFIQSLDTIKREPIILQYLIKWLSIFLDRQKRKQLPILICQNQLLRQNLSVLQNEASSKESEIKTLTENISTLQKQIEHANFGQEHLFREVGHIYDSIIVLNVDPATIELPPVQTIIHVVATLIVSGQTFEIIDGDNFYLPSSWVGQVLDQVSLNVNSKKNLTLSVLGVQSTGKSTLLNSLFGSWFPVKSGRCTRGIHMQIVPILSNRDLPFGYVTVIDSEGLRSTESTFKGHNHDNELSTVIAGLGDITLLNVMGENTSEIRDIVQVVVHAFLKLKLANKHLDIGKMFYLVHQNVIDTTAQNNMRLGLNTLIETLDSATRNAGEIEGMHEIKTFQQVIDFDVNANVWYLPSYWQGNPPMARVNSVYSDRVYEKRVTLLKKALDSKGKSFKSLTDIAVHIRDLWKGVLTEDFVFSFRNSLEIKAYIHMEERLKDILIKSEDIIENEHIILSQKLFSKCSNQKELISASESLLKRMRKVLSESMSNGMNKMKEYFEDNDYKDIVLQWEDFARKRIESLRLELDDRIKIETIRLRERTRVELTIKENSLVHEAALYERSLQVAKCIKGEGLNMQEIENKFELTWKQMSSEILNHCEFEEDSKSLASSFESCLFEIFNTEQLILKSELDKRRDVKQQGNIEEQCDASVCFLTMDTLKGSFEVSGIVLDDISFSSECFREENESKMARINDEINEILNKIEIGVTEFLKDRNDVSDREVKKMLYKIYKEIESLRNQEKGISLKITGVVKLCIHVAGFCIAQFDAHNAEYHKSKGVLARVYNYKLQVREQFIAYVKDRKAEETAAKQISITLENILWDKIKERIQVTVRSTLKQVLPQLKFHLILEVLEDLTNTDDFESFIQYIKTPRKLVKQWMKRKAKDYLFRSEKENLSIIVTKVINELYDDIEESIDKSCEHLSLESPSTDKWTEVFVKNVSKCPIRTADFQHVTKWFCQIEDIKNFSRLLHENIEDCSDQMKWRTLREAEKIIRFNGPESSVKTLFEQAWGCPEQCAFCGEPCAKGFIHNGTNHFSLQHRISCCNGAREDYIHKAVLSSCNFNVQTDLEHHCDLFNFRCNKVNKKKCEVQWHLYKNYKEYIPDWDIEPNANIQECSKFWLWFVAKYKYQLAVHYRYDVSDIPDCWDEITKEDALANLRRIYSL